MAGTQRERFSAWLQHRLGTRTQGQLAQKIGVSSSTVSRWMTGQATPGPRNILRMAEYLEVAPEEIRSVLPDPLTEAARAAREEPAPYTTVQLDPGSVHAIAAQVVELLRGPCPPPFHRGTRPPPEDSDPRAG